MRARGDLVRVRVRVRVRGRVSVRVSNRVRVRVRGRVSVHAGTIAAARCAGFSPLKMPLPTKTPSQPSSMSRPTSAGVARPPAAKVTTGNRPAERTCN